MPEIYKDDIPDAPDYDTLDSGIYRGHIFGVKSVQSRPKGGVEGGETWPMFRFFLRISHDFEGKELSKAIRLTKDLFARGQAPARKAAFIPQEATLEQYGITGDQKDLWWEASPVGKPCEVDIQHRIYQKATGDMVRDAEGHVEIDPTTGQPIPKTAEAVALDVKEFWPYWDGKCLTEQEMLDMSFLDENQVDGVDEEYPDEEKSF